MHIRCASFAALAALMTGQALAGDVFIDNYNYQQFYLNGVPDYDQVRHATTVTIGDQQWPLLGLANDGQEFCVPTSGVDWTGFLANRGYPNLLPGPGDTSGSWTDGVTGLGEYNLVDLSIAFMAAHMGTDQFKGTNGGGAATGMQESLDSAYYGYFNTVNVQGTQYGMVSMFDLVDASLNGNLVEPYGGWYVKTFDAGNTAYYRNGGHATALASAIWTDQNPGQFQIGLCNPYTSDDPTTQSAFDYTPYTTQFDIVQILSTDNMGNPIYGSGQYFFAHWLDQNALWLLDGGLEIQPVCGYTIDHSTIWYLAPLAFVNLGAFGDFPYFTLSSADQSDILSITRNPVSGNLYYITQQGGLYSVDPLSQVATSIRVNADGRPRQILFGSEANPYVLMGDGSVFVLDTATGNLSHGLRLGSIDQLAFDSNRNFIAAVDWTHNQYYLLDRHLHKQVPLPIPLVHPQGSGPISVQFGPRARLMFFQKGDPNLYDYQPAYEIVGSIVRTLHTTHYLPAVQKSDSFSIDDKGKLYFSLNGQIVTLNGDGRTLNWPFNGLPSGIELNITRSVSNYDPAIHGTPAWRNVPPPAGAGG